MLNKIFLARGITQAEQVVYEHLEEVALESGTLSVAQNIISIEGVTPSGQKMYLASMHWEYVYTTEGNVDVVLLEPFTYHKGGLHQE